jgi:glycosyltransferase involved in cell wall biosynthesis
MQIALYLKHFPAAGAPLIGGTSTAVDGLASGLVQNGADTVVLCEGAARSSAVAAAGYRIECFRNRGRYRSFGVARELRDYLAARERRPDLCLLNGMFHPACFALGRVLRRQGVPYIAIPHDPYDRWVFGRNSHLKLPYWYLFERRHLREARAVQVLDRRHEAPLRRLGVDTPVIEAPNGVAAANGGDDDFIQGAPPILRAQQAPSVVFLGRLDAYNKGLDTLIDAFAHVTEDAGQRPTLSLRGPDCGDRAQLQRRVAALGLCERVAFLDPDYTRSPVQILADHDLLCLPSRFEGFGLVALEAMLAGRVLLVSERAGVARHVVASGCGLSVPPNVEDLAAGLRALLARREAWAEMGRRGRRYALERLQWKSVAADALASYARLLN